MAKDRDNLAGSLDAEDTGGLLSGFLAEEDEFDRRALWRLGSWGIGAVGAVIVAVMANQSQISGRRDQVAAVDLVRQAQQIQAVAKESQNQARQLASAIDTLNSDRDRLYSRVTTLEQGLDSVTGAVARQTTPPVAPPAQAAPADGPSAQSAAPAPAVGPVATAMPVQPAPDKPAAAAKPAGAEKPTAPEKPVAADKPPAPEKLPAVASTEPNPPSAPPANQEIANTVSATLATPLMASKSMMAPPDPVAGKLAEPPGQPASTVTASPIPELAPAPTSEAESEEVRRPPFTKPSSQLISAAPIRWRACARCGAGC